MSIATPAPNADKPLKIAMVGTAPTSRMLAPFNDPDWEIWACSMGNMNVLPRVNIWFEMHAVREMMAAENRTAFEPFYAWLKQHSEAGTFQVVMPEFNDFIPKAIPYPLDEMIQRFKTRNWFTSTIAYMMAVAIARGAKEIGLFGIDMAAGQEHYEAQRAACTWWIEKAESLGITVHVPYESSLKIATPLYGYWEGTPFGRRINAVRLQVRTAVQNLQQQIAALNSQLAYFQGADEQLGYFQRTWVDGIEQELNLGNLQEVVDNLKAKGAAPEELDRIMKDAPITIPMTASPVTLNTSTAFDRLLKPAQPNGALHEPEPPTETMQS